MARTGCKADLMKCLEGCLEESSTPNNTKPHSDAIILESSVMVKILKPGNANNFKHYADLVYLAYIYT